MSAQQPKWQNSCSKMWSIEQLYIELGPTRPVLIMKQQQLVFKITIFSGKIEKWVGTLVGYSYQIFTVYKSESFLQHFRVRFISERLQKLYLIWVSISSLSIFCFCFLPLNLFDCLLFYFFALNLTIFQLMALAKHSKK